MRFSEFMIVPLLAAAVEARACKAKRPTTAALATTALADSTSPVVTTAVFASSTAAGAPSASSAISSLSSSTASAFSSEAFSSTSVSPKPTTNSSEAVSSTFVSSKPIVTSTAPSVHTTLTTAVTSSAKPTSTEAKSTSAKPAATSAPYRAYPADVVDKLRDSSIANLESYTKRNPSSCTLENASIRREWSDLSIAEREEYISAVQCLQRLPANTSSSVSPGARSRFDDFLTVHIQQTPYIHNTANFLGWHRYYVWQYEKALREECNYKGFQPYWNWNREVADPTKSAMFNGNATSLSGNSPSKDACVNSGPFKDMSVNLGPGNSLKYNPRCLKRDISASQAQACTADKTLSLIKNSATIGSFQDTMQAIPGVHAGGHYTIGGDPGGDIYTSAGDPAFYFHHAMIDRVWWLWQLQDLENRLTAVDGNNNKNGRKGTVNDDTNLGGVAGSVKLGDLLNTMGGKGGEFCYIYV
ncbi:uncharacterized protein PgNI_12502 [Pyricularia grisea]|uniref:Tyrosinase copper-binding domain-containing protein n=1 Tax=Pyricularia grisea TaxID=148305 RepID=A0A6P8AME8_PYRGI|nr:uncharacterized protein PgNI_12502 [Pyricularia grisea]TLD03220.1 hypothetical protein PgNI_12502 [Pyricularia grisea]